MRKGEFVHGVSQRATTILGVEFQPSLDARVLGGLTFPGTTAERGWICVLWRECHSTQSSRPLLQRADDRLAGAGLRWREQLA